VRYPRGTGPGAETGTGLEPLALGKAAICRRGRRIAILAFGSVLDAALEAADRVDASVVNMRFVKPLDREVVLAMAQQHDLVVTIEEHAIAGGAGSAVNELLAAERCNCPIINLGVPDRFIEHGDHAGQLAQCGLDAGGILAAITAITASDASLQTTDTQNVTAEHDKQENLRGYR
jgi:1-deoxy-D-xylulose-5-phosphate synthase